MKEECDICGDKDELTPVNNVGNLCKDCYDGEIDDELD